MDRRKRIFIRNLTTRKILAIAAMILIGFVMFLIGKYVLHIELPP